MSAPPDFEKEAREFMHCNEETPATRSYPVRASVASIAEALQAAYERGAKDERARAAKIALNGICGCESNTALLILDESFPAPALDAEGTELLGKIKLNLARTKQEPQR